MKDDFIEKLRNKNWRWTVPGAMRLEAADEIERLRASRDELTAVLERHHELAQRFTYQTSRLYDDTCAAIAKAMGEA